MTIEIQRLAAFPYGDRGGNPAGVVLNGEGLDDSQMQQIAAQVGYSETVFVTKRIGSRLRVRYFSPEMEVDFCGHATIAAGVALGADSASDVYIFETNIGDVKVKVARGPLGNEAQLTSTKAQISAIEEDDLRNLLGALGWTPDLLAKGYEPLIANAGNSHPVIVVASPETLRTLNYDFEALKSLCRARNWPTVQLVAQEAPRVWQSRNPFAFGGVYEDPATGSAAAAFGVYLRETKKIEPGESLTIKQGFSMGQPCLLAVTVGHDHCTVSGTAIEIRSDLAGSASLQ